MTSNRTKGYGKKVFLTYSHLSGLRRNKSKHNIDRWGEIVKTIDEFGKYVLNWCCKKMEEEGINIKRINELINKSKEIKLNLIKCQK